MVWFCLTCIVLTLVTAASLLRQILARRKAEALLNEANEKIQQREKKLQTILDNAPIVFSAINRDGIFQISEGKGLEKLGRRSNQSIGLSIYEMHNRNPLILDAVSKALAGVQSSTTFVLRGITFDLFIVPEKNADGQVIGASMLSVDISERKKIEEEKAQLLFREQSAIETSRLKSDFLATMSHEIRTPINGVLGMNSLLMETALSPQQKEFAEGIQSSGHALLTLINDILDFSKIEAGHLDFEEIEFNLTQAIERAIKNLSFSAQTKGIELRSEVSAELRPLVKGDPTRFSQILNNLIGNAIKFTNAGYVSVRFLAVRQSELETTLRVEVSDTGIGIPKDAIEKMFTPFTQADTSMSRRFGGTGLGLSISKQLVEKMGGTIGVESELGRGSTFWFTIKLKSGRGRQVAIVNGDQFYMQSSPVFNGDSPHVLVVEDNQINQLITVQMLKKLGCTSTIAANGLEALEAFEKFDFDLILMDCQMPVMDGLEATRRMRSCTFERNRNIPILAVTANAMKGDEENCLAAGMDDYIAKPVTAGQLTSYVSRWLNIRKERVLKIAS